MTDTVYTIKELAAYLKCSESKAKSMCAAGEIVAFKVGNEWRVRQSALEAFMQSTSTEKVVNIRMAR